MPEFCYVTFQDRTQDLDAQLSAVVEFLRSQPAQLGVELAPDARAMFSEAWREITLNCLRNQGGEVLAAVARNLLVFRAIEQRETRSVLFAHALAAEAELLLQLLIEPVLPSKPRAKPSRRPERPSSPLDALKARIAGLLADQVSHARICRTLDRERFSTPPATHWSDLPWTKAFETHSRSVATWISKCRATER